MSSGWIFAGCARRLSRALSLAQACRSLSDVPGNAGRKQGMQIVNGNRIQLKRPQREVFLSPHRFRLLVAGRRFGKTYLANVELFRAAWGRGRMVWYVAPT